MTPTRTSSTLLAIVAGLAVLALSTPLHAKPLKVFILAGQSNMEGHARTTTFPAIAKDPKTADLYKMMVDAGGEPVVRKDVWISYAFGDFAGDPAGTKAGQLSAGWGSQHHADPAKIGPEFTFGITLHEKLGEPILLIKNAWGGKSLMVDFRPPSAGEITDEAIKAKAGDKAGKYYALMMEHVKEVLADPKKVYPDYDPKEGYDLAGFVWFQGFNDLVGPYPQSEPAKGNKRAIKDYSEYSRLLGCLIRDVRKDLTAPKLPFVIGVLGVGGDSAGENTDAFRKSMAAPAESDEFKDTVTNVFTQKYWPADVDAVMNKVAAVKKTFERREKAIKSSGSSREEMKKATAALDEEKRAAVDKALTPDEIFLRDHGVSNFAFHYYGSAQFFGLAGKAFAEALLPHVERTK